MENMIKPKEKEASLNGTRKIFGIIRNKENFQKYVETSLTFPTSEMTKELRNCEIQAELIKAIVQSHRLTRLL